MHARHPHQLRIPFRVNDVHVGKLHVQVLVHGVQRARQRHVILQLHSDLFSHQGLEERVEQLAICFSSKKESPKPDTAGEGGRGKRKVQHVLSRLTIRSWGLFIDRACNDTG